MNVCGMCSESRGRVAAGLSGERTLDPEMALRPGRSFGHCAEMGSMRSVLSICRMGTGRGSETG